MRLLRLLALAWTLLAACAAAATPRGERLEAAARSGDLEALEAALAEGAPVDHLRDDPHHMALTPLEWAAREGRREAALRLLAHGAALRHDARRGLYAASFAAGHDDPLLMAALWERAAPGTRATPLFGPALVQAARSGHAGVVDWLLARGVDPDFHTRGDAYPRPAALEAARYGHHAIVRALVAAGASPDPPLRGRDATPLMQAAASGDLETVRFLLERGADPDRRVWGGNAVTAGACAVTSQNAEHRDDINAAVRLLVERGVGFDVPNRKQTPLGCAREFRNAELARYLEAAGARERVRLGYRVRKALLTAVFMVAPPH